MRSVGSYGPKDAQADLSLRLAHTHFVVAHLLLTVPVRCFHCGLFYYRVLFFCFPFVFDFFFFLLKIT